MSDPSRADATDPESDEAVTVSVSPNGQATIPKAFRDKLGITSPGRVQFRETDDGEIVVERVPSVEEMRGFAAERTDASTDKPASQLLREQRAEERADRDQA
ncbi:AbrB/MazE/SpoVT family DNA-binding domain-containing protein [Halapricum sp. CBA1109]|uniref:AbrB/MazE/SpoVT family DNA-binding domain-containing protein n=1 Tax=Halapricum sp. CBA1109 TaxID=2668068 RepID=UPI0012F94F63|nr:AbrB/MazE/SpoVT family DNA-binding domain-containing protein [Halapricum sp. CBA1109]MUV88907.1 AbrB/MazE/SpoVT family DNA-binding domain-containing protein [Halapricum sp. CBA1109]